MLKKTPLKQGTLAWEKARASRIGSSEVFDIVKYYATAEELQNCGINAERFREEKPYTTVWALYHKMLNDGLYRKEYLAPEFSEYGHTIEPYGVRCLQAQRNKRLKPGEVYIDDNFIASLDISGVAESVDIVPFAVGNGTPQIGQSFVCEQKSMMPVVIKNGIPFKYIIQAQYQISRTGKDFYILQIMLLDDDTPFHRGKVCQMPRAKLYKYLDENMSVVTYYFKNNQHIERLIDKCLDRFLEDVKNRKEPTPYIEYDTQKNIIESIRLNVAYNDKAVFDYDLGPYIDAKQNENIASCVKTDELQKIVEFAKQNNACRFRSDDGIIGSFGKDGSFRLRYPAVME